MKSRNSSLGTIMRSLRSTNGWTLREMSARTGIPISSLTKVEHDRLTLTYERLEQISRRLGIPLPELFAPADEKGTPTVTARRSVGYLHDAIRIETADYDRFWLCPELRRKRMVPVLARIRTKAADHSVAFCGHPGEEFVFVLNGRIRVMSEFYDPLLLNAGESIYLDSSMAHAFVTAEDCEEALILSLCSGSNECLMGSAWHPNGEANSAWSDDRSRASGLPDSPFPRFTGLTLPLPHESDDH
jgi:transcriptional regulator with XRE-family HTH domain